VGTWNVWTPYRSGALENLMNALQQYNVDITAIQEMKLTGQNIMNKKNVHHIIDFPPPGESIHALRIKGKCCIYSLHMCI
jgi:hypothetical protein